MSGADRAERSTAAAPATSEDVEARRDAPSATDSKSGAISNENERDTSAPQENAATEKPQSRAPGESGAEGTVTTPSQDTPAQPPAAQGAAALKRPAPPVVIQRKKCDFYRRSVRETFLHFKSELIRGRSSDTRPFSGNMKSVLQKRRERAGEGGASCCEESKG